MKITKEQLQKLIKEAVSSILNEEASVSYEEAISKLKNVRLAMAKNNLKLMMGSYEDATGDVVKNQSKTLTAISYILENMEENNFTKALNLFDKYVPEHLKKDLELVHQFLTERT